MTIAFQCSIRLLKAATFNEDRLSRAAKCARLGYWEWNLIQSKAEWSDKMFEMFGVDKTMDDVPSVLDYIHQDDKDRLSTAVQNTIETGDEHRLVYRIQRKDGTMRKVIANGVLIRNEHGTPSAMVGTLQDITDIDLVIDASRELITLVKDELEPA
ncbi:MAG: PAS domain-containing protein [Gammaproteobacteria bacterium]|nr:PAS domain-containing protein [Gammaproteobacteria bacterium]